jgi:hypothetical protein
MTGATDRKLVGMVYPKDILGSGDQAPVDCMDQRFVAYDGRKVNFSKLNPYAGNTFIGTSAADTWEVLASYFVEGVFLGNESLFLSFTGCTNYSNGDNTRMTFGVNGTEPTLYANKVCVASNMIQMEPVLIYEPFEGYDRFNVLIRTAQIAAQAITAWYSDNREAVLHGSIK